MKKMRTAILLFDIMAGLLLLGWNEMHSRTVAADSRLAMPVEEEEKLEAEDVRKIAITFDDGPHPYYTEQLLDGLKERGVVATFFVTGEHAELHPEIIERMIDDA